MGVESCLLSDDRNGSKAAISEFAVLHGSFADISSAMTGALHIRKLISSEFLAHTCVRA